MASGCIPCVTGHHDSCSWRTGKTPLPCPCKTCDPAASMSSEYLEAGWGRYGYGDLKPRVVPDVAPALAPLKSDKSDEPADDVDAAVDAWLARKRGGHVLTSTQPSMGF